MTQMRCVRHTLEDQYGHVVAWQVTPASNRPTWPDALQGASLINGWIEKTHEPYWGELPDQPTDPVRAGVWQAVAARLYQAVVAYHRSSTDPELDSQALAAMALYDAEVGWEEPEFEPPAEMALLPEAYLG